MYGRYNHNINNEQGWGTRSAFTRQLGRYFLSFTSAMYSFLVEVHHFPGYALIYMLEQ